MDSSYCLRLNISQLVKKQNVRTCSLPAKSGKVENSTAKLTKASGTTWLAFFGGLWSIAMAPPLLPVHPPLEELGVDTELEALLLERPTPNPIARAAITRNTAKKPSTVRLRLPMGRAIAEELVGKQMRTVLYWNRGQRHMALM